MRTRRSFLKGMTIAAAAALCSACRPEDIPAPVPTAGRPRLKPFDPLAAGRRPWPWPEDFDPRDWDVHEHKFGGQFTSPPDVTGEPTHAVEFRGETVLYLHGFELNYGQDIVVYRHKREDRSFCLAGGPPRGYARSGGWSPVVPWCPILVGDVTVRALRPEPLDRDVIKYILRGFRLTVFEVEQGEFAFEFDAMELA